MLFAWKFWSALMRRLLLHAINNHFVSEKVVPLKWCFKLRKVSKTLILCVVAGGNPIVMYLWGEKAAPPLHSLHFGFGLGGVISAQMTRPFLQPISTNYNVTENVGFFDTTAIMSNNDVTIATIPLNTPDVIHTSRLVFPYSMASAFSVIVGISLITIHVRGTPNGFPKRQPKNKFRELLSPGSCAYGRQLYGAAMLFLMFLFYVFVVGGEKAYGNFIFSYAVDADVSFSKGKAAHLLTVFYTSHLTGRFLGIFISHFLPIHWLIFGDIIGGLLTMILGVLLAYDNETALWATTGLAGACVSILYPAGLAWANTHLEVCVYILKWRICPASTLTPSTKLVDVIAYNIWFITKLILVFPNNIVQWAPIRIQLWHR